MRYKDHPNQDVRFSVAYALGHFPNDPSAISALIPLTRDPDSEVRDWAVFGLGVQGDVDSSEIREALLQRISDSDEDVREEATVGLGKRQDLRLLPSLRDMLNAPELKVRIAEAASALLGLPEDPEEWEPRTTRRLSTRSMEEISPARSECHNWRELDRLTVQSKIAISNTRQFHDGFGPDSSL